MKYAVLLAAAAAPAAQAADRPIETWNLCLRARAAVYAASPESAETVADAAIGACTSEQQAAFRAMGTDQDARPRIVASYRGRTLAYVMDLRTSAAQAATPH